MNVLTGEILKFIRTKEYIYLRNIGQGGTGKTILVKDPITDINFICKKYYPQNVSKKVEYFKRFIEEIKIMYLLSHPNIVRIYNYYLYPESNTGYILMEYVEGSKIDNYLIFENNNVYEDIFFQLIEGFKYLEENNILHRDIRNENILISNNGIVKIIDFGFGKKNECKSKENASIILNWPVTELPDEIYNSIYNHQTEVYFVGKLFNGILESGFIDDFKYQHIIDKMIVSNPNKRVKSFSEVIQLMSEDIFEELDFEEAEKEIYLTFSDCLISHVTHISNKLVSITEPNKIIGSLENLIKGCLLEHTLQNNDDLISCFMENGYRYSPKKDIDVKVIREFYNFFKNCSILKQKIILSNIISRLKGIKVVKDDDELPF